MNIPCPECNFALIVTNRKILGRPARCPICHYKFILREPEQSLANGWSPPDAADEVSLMEQTVDLRDLSIDRGRLYITLLQIRMYNTPEEADCFERWVADKTSIDAMSESGFFLEDYDEWLRLGKPDGPESARD